MSKRMEASKVALPEELERRNQLRVYVREDQKELIRKLIAVAYKKKIPRSQAIIEAIERYVQQENSK